MQRALRRGDGANVRIHTVGRRRRRSKEVIVHGELAKIQSKREKGNGNFRAILRGLSVLGYRRGVRIRPSAQMDAREALRGRDFPSRSTTNALKAFLRGRMLVYTIYCLHTPPRVYAMKQRTRANAEQCTERTSFSYTFASYLPLQNSSELSVGCPGLLSE